MRVELDFFQALRDRLTVERLLPSQPCAGGFAADQFSPAQMAELSAPSGRAGLSPFQPVTIGMGSNIMVASEVAEDAGSSVLTDAIAFGGVVWKEASIVDCVDAYTALYIDGSHGSLDKK